MPTIKHLNALCVVQVDFDIWSGQTRLSASDLKLGEGGKVPPEKVAQLGSKKICDPAKLKGFHRLKTETRRLLLRYGMPFMNGFAVPLDKREEISQRLDKIWVEFDLLKQEFLSDYDSAVEEWIKENPEYEEAIRAGALPRRDVEKRIGFEYQLFMIQPVDEDETNARRLNMKVERLGDDLISEVVREASDFYADRLAGRDHCSVATQQTLRNIRDKVDGLSFLNSAFEPLVRLLDETLEGYKLHAQGRKIVAPFFYQVMSAVLIMSDRAKIAEYADGKLSVESMANQAAVIPDGWAGMTEQSVSLPESQDESESSDTDLSATPRSDQNEQAQTPGSDPDVGAGSEEEEEEEEVQEETRLEEDIDSFFEQFEAEQKPAQDGQCDAAEEVGAVPGEFSEHVPGTFLQERGPVDPPEPPRFDDEAEEGDNYF